MSERASEPSAPAARTPGSAARRDPVTLSDPKAIRALAHPARLAVIEELYSGREMTATEAGDLAGMSPSAMSYHLRNLERAGIVERADAGADGRERPWRAAGAYLEVQSDSFAAEAAALSTTVLSRLSSQYADWLQRRPRETKTWQDSSTVASGQFWMTSDELADLTKNVEKLLDVYRERIGGERPPDARRVRIAVFAFPSGQ